MTVPDGRIFAIGGQDCDAEGNELELSTVEAYTPSKNTWESAADLLGARDSHAATGASDGRIFAIGGANGGTSRSNRWLEVAERMTRLSASRAPTRAR